MKQIYTSYKACAIIQGMIAFFLLTFTLSYSQTPTWQWAKRVGSFNDNPPFVTGDQNEKFNDVKTDKQGNVYAVGAFFQNSAFDNQTTGFPTTGGYGARDAYLVKFSRCGKTLWWRRMGSANTDAATSLVLDNNGHVIVGGNLGGSSNQFGDGVHDTLFSSGSSMFIAKFDTAGSFINVNTYSNFSSTSISPNTSFPKLFITSQNNYLLTNGLSGYAISSILGTTTNTYNYAIPTPFIPEIRGVTLDKNDNLYICGSFNNTVNIGGTTLQPTPSTLIPNNNAANSLIVKYSSTGSLLWYKRSNGSVTDGLFSCTVDTSGTKVAVGGGATNGLTVFGYYINGGVGSVAMVLYLLDATTGNLVSATTGSTNSHPEIRPTYTDRDNNFICIGTTYGFISYNSNTTTVSAGTYQNVIGKFNTNGSFQWLNLLPQTGSSAGNPKETIEGIDEDEQGNIYIAGMFGGTLDSLGTAVNIIGGSEDGFVAKYGYACNSNSTSLSPLPPTSLTAMYQATLTNHVTWVDNANYETNYELWCSTNGGAYSLLATLPANTTTYTHTSLNYNSNYCYKARAINNVGNSAFTNIGCAATPTTTGQVPNAPLNLTATNNGSLTNNVTWTDNSPNEDNFELHYTFGGNTTYSLLATLPANTTTYTHTGLSYTTTYCYKVAATNTTGTSAFTNTDCATTPAAPTNTNSGTGIVELKDESLKLRVYPNPANEVLNVECEMMNGELEMRIYDVLGSVIKVEKLKLKNGLAQISVNDLPKGIYFVKVDEEVRKFVKE